MSSARAREASAPRTHSITRTVEVLTPFGGTGSMSLFDHLLFGANVDASGSSTHAEGRVYADTFSKADDILLLK